MPIVLSIIGWVTLLQFPPGNWSLKICLASFVNAGNITTAQKDMANFKCTFQKRKAEIARKRKQALADAFAKTKKQEENRIQKLENYTSDIVYYQLWQSVDQVDLKLSYIPLITETFRFSVSSSTESCLFLLSTDFENKNTLGLSGFCFKTCCLKFN
jgi:hypothetical protein